MATAAEPLTIAVPPAVDEPLYEVVDGQRVELPEDGQGALIASLLASAMGQFPRVRACGRMLIRMLFRLSHDGPQRRPDVAYVSYARWPKGRPIPPGDTWDVVPELAIEVVSPSNTAAGIVEKLRDYFAAGVGRVWVIYPEERLVHVYRSLLEMRGVGADGVLDGEDVLPGLRLPVAELFEDAEPADAPGGHAG
jgi:Uma2 family endonuclease